MYQFLMLNPAVTLGLIVHFLADFHFQTPKMAAAKRDSWQSFMMHLLIVWLLLIPMYVVFPLQSWGIAAVGLIHIAIDACKKQLSGFLIRQNLLRQQTTDALVFLCDQLIHIAAIMSLLQRNNLAQSNSYLPYVLFFVMITKPINVTFKLLFSKYQPEQPATPEEDTIAGAGATIGTMERLTIAILLLFQQFAALGLVFTAKSIARYDRISKSARFAEYYLIGSLFSLMGVLVCYWLCLGA